MSKHLTIPSRDQIAPDTPLRLEVAAAVAFPDGSMSAGGLRAEARRDRLVVERIAGKDYTTLENITRMRELCRARRPAAAPTVPVGHAGLEALRAIERELKNDKAKR